MPSQEEYLDQLLQNLTENHGKDSATATLEEIPDSELGGDMSIGDLFSEDINEIPADDMDALLKSLMEADTVATDEADVSVDEFATDEADALVDEFATDEADVLVDEFASDEADVSVDEFATDGADVSVDEFATDEADALVDEFVTDEADVLVDEFAADELDLLSEDMAIEESEALSGEFAEEELPQTEQDIHLDDVGMEDMLSIDDLFAEEAAAEESASAEDLFGDMTTALGETGEMTEEEIEQLLHANQSEEFADFETVDATGLTDFDNLSDLLGESDDADLMEIQRLLEKSDNNELIEDIADAGALAAGAGFAEETVNKADEKKMLREAKKEARKAAKEAKKAEKSAKKAQKASLKKSKQKNAEEKEDNTFADAENMSEDFESALTDDFGVSEASGTEVAQPTEEIPEELAAEDALLRELESFDFLNDMDFGSSEADVHEAVQSASADALAQVIEQGEKSKTKKSLFTRLKEFINEEDVDEPENENIQLSDENQNIIKEMDKEKKKGKKAKKKGKKNAAADGENQESAEEGDDSQKDKKSKKEKKPKKEKPQKEVSLEPHGKKIPLKHIVMAVAVCFSIGFAIILFVNVVGEYSVKQAGKKAFYAGDYQTCYQNLFGKDLNESEQVMYSKSESILTIRLWIREYELLAGEGQEVKALDSLLQFVYYYPILYTHSAKWNADTEVAECYNQILSILSDKYHLTEEQAMEIINNPDDIQYTKMVMAIAQGEAFGSWNESDMPQEAPEVLQDPLPEEEGLSDSNFVDNK